MSSKPAVIPAIFLMRCPNCRKGSMFANKSVFPLNRCLKMADHCSKCGQQMLYESNNGPGVNYALTVIIFFLNLCWYWPLFGLSYKDNSIFYYMLTSTAVVILIQPWLMRLSRVIYLYIFLAFKED